MDVRSFIKKTTLLLDMDKTNLDEIIDEIIQKMLGHLKNPTCLDQAKAALFTHDYGRLHDKQRQHSAGEPVMNNQISSLVPPSPLLNLWFYLQFSQADHVGDSSR